jgi:general secretion pathway protein D
MRRAPASAPAVAAALAIVLLTVPALAQEAEAPTGPFAIRDLQRQTYQVSCVDVESCIKTLSMLGYNTQAPSGQVNLDQLPAVFPLPFKGPEEIVGHSSYSEEKAADKVALRGETLSAPENRLLILYHPSQTEEVGKLLDLLQSTVDVPDRQVLIEGMVIELTEDDFKELGAEWQLSLGNWLVSFLAEGENVPFIMSYNPDASMTAGLTEHLRATIRAVIQEGKAEVLSSPSVLVLNNRNARIKVVRDTPIISTKITRDVQNVDVRFEPVGIVLNIKPRISQDGSAVTMQIIAEVSEVPEGKSIVVQGTEVAPVIDRRIVETVARVHDNTPFIIGGLIRNEKASTTDRVPILSRIPLLGVLFRHNATTRGRREVIIVLTPRVITTGGTHRPVLPKDTARFDFLDNQLFRNSYRIKAENVFDLSFLENNETVLTAFDQALRLVRKHPEYADKAPFHQLAARIIPGEDAVVVRMIYEIVGKSGLKFNELIPTDNVIFLKEDSTDPGGFSVGALEIRTGRKAGGGLLQKNSPDGTLEGFFARKFPKKVLFLRFPRLADGTLNEALEAPVATVEWLDVETADPAEAQKTIEEHLLELNTIDPSDLSQPECALVLDTADDLVRLKTAIAIREVAQVNNFEELMTLRNFRVGRRFVLPEFDPASVRSYLIDRSVAEYFYKSDYYYHALKERLARGYTLLQEALAKEGVE